MKYEKILQDRGLAEAELSKGIQEKIARLQKLVSKAIDFEKSEKLTKSQRESFNKVKEQIEGLDIEVAEKVKKFDPELQKKRLEIVANAQSKLPKNQPHKIDELKETVKVNPKVDLKEPEEIKTVEAEEVKAEDYSLQPIQPKRNSWALIMMVAGAVLMGIGGYNFFKNK